MMYLLLLTALACVRSTPALRQSTNQWANRSTIVHLFEWKWDDVGAECERFLAPRGYGGVQVSPPAENLIIRLGDGSRPWWERYQPVSYRLVTRSGDERAFRAMSERCNRVGVRIYVDVVANHMTGGGDAPGSGTGGSKVDFAAWAYPAVPYHREHFHPDCSIHNYNDATEIRACALVGLRDLNQASAHVRERLLGYLNHLISLGVAGFRMDAAKHMWPSDLKAIYDNLDDLNTAFNFPPRSRPYIYQEVIHFGDNGAVRPEEYTPLGAVTEFRVGSELREVFRGHNMLKWLKSWGEQWGLLPSESAFVFIDNHDSQRGHTGDGVLTYKEPRAYKAAIAFMLAHPFGEPRVMSSYFFEKSDQGPPADSSDNILSPTINKDNTCGNGWVCEHRWRQIYQMVGFRNVAHGGGVTNWWDNGGNQIAFSRGDRAFIAFNLEGHDLNHTLQTGLAAGDYCDVVSGSRVAGRDSCAGARVTVGADGRAHILLRANHEDTFLAIHAGPESSLQA